MLTKVLSGFQQFLSDTGNELSDPGYIARRSEEERRQAQAAQVGNILRETQQLPPEQRDIQIMQKLFSEGSPIATGIAKDYIPTPDRRLAQEQGLSQINTNEIQTQLAQNEDKRKDRKLSLDEENIRAQIEKSKAEIDRIRSGKVEPDKAFDMEAKLRNEYTNLSKEFVQVRNAYDKISSLTDNASGPNDIALIYNFMKMQDPGSTVREGEYATAGNAGGATEYVRNLYNKVKDGLILTPKVRNDFLKTAGTINQSAIRQQDKISKQYEGLAKRAGVSPEQVLIDFSAAPQPIKEGQIITDGKGNYKIRTKTGWQDYKYK